MVYIGIFMFACSLPAFLRWRTERRKRRLAQARLDLSRSVTRMERVMLAGEITIGDVSHDILFRTMQRIQNSNVYDVRWNFLRKPNETVANLEQRLVDELNEKSCPFAEISWDFTMAYFKCFRLKHPFKSVAYILYLQALRNGLKAVLVAFLCILRINQAIEGMQDRRKAIYRESGAAFLPSSHAAQEPVAHQDEEIPQAAIA